MTDIAQGIREALASVARTRQETLADPALGAAVTAIKTLQARRFAGSYADILGGGASGYQPAAEFFLTELYSAQDYTDRDAQFARIAGPIDKLFPAKVGALAMALAQLHALTEELDQAMGRAWMRPAAAPKPAQRNMAPEADRYAAAWRQVGRRSDRQSQLDIVLGIGQELGKLTRMIGLRGLLRMMRGPAHAAGLAALQSFLESGFDTFAALARTGGGVQGFLDLIAGREQALITMLFDDDLVTCGTELQRTLGQAP